MAKAISKRGGMMEPEEIEVKVIRQGGGFFVRCPRCLNTYSGNKLDSFLRNKIPMPCREGISSNGCKAILLLSE